MEDMKEDQEKYEPFPALNEDDDGIFRRLNQIWILEKPT